MTSVLKKAGLAVALGATALTVAAPAQAQRYGGYRHYGHGDAAGAALVGGLAGLAIGAAIADRGPRHYYYDDYYAYPRGYYAYGPRYHYRPYGYYGRPAYRGYYGYHGGYGYGYGYRR
jgi:hypothetical protein